MYLSSISPGEHSKPSVVGRLAWRCRESGRKTCAQASNIMFERRIILDRLQQFWLNTLTTPSGTLTALCHESATPRSHWTVAAYYLGLEPERQRHSPPTGSAVSGRRSCQRPGRKAPLKLGSDLHRPLNNPTGH
eukprot:scaffold10085_cov120-Isochrysis_galbana.AAC.1